MRRINNNEKKKIIIFFLTLVILVSLVTGFTACGNDKESEEEQKKQEELKMAYEKQNKALQNFDNQFWYLEYKPGTLNADGINVHEYIRYAYYHKETKKIMTHEQVVEYLEKEYEDNGEIRIYTNGQHPEIAAYVEWVWEHQEELQEYRDKLLSIYNVYRTEYQQKGFDGEPMYDWPTEIVDELIKKEADPDYELDLIGIQQRQREEAGE